jgi:hypothetical protein
MPWSQRYEPTKYVSTEVGASTSFWWDSVEIMAQNFKTSSEQMDFKIMLFIRLTPSFPILVM